MKKFLFVSAIFGVIMLIAEKARQKKTAFQGLTEGEARDRIVQRFPDKVPEEKRDAIADTIVSKMRERGILALDELDDTAIDLKDSPVEETLDAV